MDNFSKQFKTTFTKNANYISTNNYILGGLLLLGVYIALSCSKVHNSIVTLFENPIFRLLVIACILYCCDKEPQLALLIAASFLITMHMINKQKVENFSSTNPGETATTEQQHEERLREQHQRQQHEERLREQHQQEHQQQLPQQHQQHQQEHQQQQKRHQRQHQQQRKRKQKQKQSNNFLPERPPNPVPHKHNPART